MSKKKKGLSGDEKRDVILGIYHECLEPLNLKEIENLASRAGVVQQTVKEHNQSLVDDSLVQNDKMGSSVFFWSFPSQAIHEKKTKLETLYASIRGKEAELSGYEDRIASLLKDRSRPDREALITEIRRLSAIEKELDTELDKYKNNDPIVIQGIRDQCRFNKEGAERWTENTWSVKSYLTKKRGQPGKDVDQLLGIDASFEDMTYKKKKTSGGKR